MKKSDRENIVVQCVVTLLQMGTETYELTKIIALPYNQKSKSDTEFVKALFEFTDKRRPLALVDKNLYMFMKQYTRKERGQYDKN